MTRQSLTRSVLVVGTMLVVALLAAASAAQRRAYYGAYEPAGNRPYDGRFAFVRVRYRSAPGGNWAGPAWAHGYPVAEQNLLRIMLDISLLDSDVEAINVITLDDPELFRYPIAYITEVGWWTLTDEEAAGLRAYLQKGGFLIVDDFKPEGWRGLYGGGWEPFAAAMRRVLPDARFFDLGPDAPIFHTFFEIPAALLDDFPQAYNFGRPVFRGIYEDNDPRKRLLVMVNYNTDVSQYWEWSGYGIRPFGDTSDAYKLGVNYLIYGMTH